MGYSDFNKKREGDAGEFHKDKRRRRTVTVEAVTRSPRSSEKPAYQPRENHENSFEKAGQPQRRSYNPNFSADNKFIGGSKPEKQERDFNRWEPQPERQGSNWRGNQEGGGAPHYGNQPNTSFGKKSYGGERPDRPSGQKPYGDKKPYNGRKPVRKPFVKKGEGVMDPGMKPAFYPSYSMPGTGKEIRLNRFIAMSGKCSRREADEYIQAGEVTVNGQVITELGVKVQPTDEVRLKGERLSSERKVYIIMNKPKGYVTSVDDPHAEKTVMEIVRNACEERIYPVGRLDKSSVGVLLLTNDGDMTEKLTHPSHNKKKVYQVTLERPLTNFDLQRARDGIDLDDGVIIPDAVNFVKPDNRKEVGIEIHSGRNRIVRRIFEELGYGVHKLDRVYFAGLTKKNLKRGQWRFLTDQEVGMLKSGRYE